jgi:hypothetical protein
MPKDQAAPAIEIAPVRLRIHSMIGRLNELAAKTEFATVMAG